MGFNLGFKGLNVFTVSEEVFGQCIVIKSTDQGHQTFEHRFVIVL